MRLAGPAWPGPGGPDGRIALVGLVRPGDRPGRPGQGPRYSGPPASRRPAGALVAAASLAPDSLARLVRAAGDGPGAGGRPYPGLGHSRRPGGRRGLPQCDLLGPDRGPRGAVLCPSSTCLVVSGLPAALPVPLAVLAPIAGPPDPRPPQRLAGSGPALCPGLVSGRPADLLRHQRQAAPLSAAGNAGGRPHPGLYPGAPPACLDTLAARPGPDPAGPGHGLSRPGAPGFPGRRTARQVFASLGGRGLHRRGPPGPGARPRPGSAGATSGRHQPDDCSLAPDRGNQAFGRGL